MRKIALALGYLVIAATVNASEGATEDAFLMAKCNFGSNGFVVFREKAPAGKGGKKLLAQQEESGEDEGESEIEASETAPLEGGKKPLVKKSEEESESASGSEEEASAEAAGKSDKVVNIACTYTEQNKKKDTAKVSKGSRSASKDKKTKTVTRGRSPAHHSDCSDDDAKSEKSHHSDKSDASCSKSKSKSRSPSPKKKPTPPPKKKFEEDKDCGCAEKPTLEGEFHFEKL